MLSNRSCPVKQTNVEVADIFRRYGPEYRRQNKLTIKQHKVMGAIENCRTAVFGHHIDTCDNCGHSQKEYNSCRDRHCPKCQGISRRKWVEKRVKEVLPVSYYHTIFTLPNLLDRLTSYNKKLIYDLLFSTASATLLTFGRDPKWIGGEIGFFGILHTWGQTLWPHPHIHFIVPGGALTKDNQWKEAPQRGKFLFPVRALSKVFRGKFIEGLKKAHRQHKLSFSPEDNNLTCPITFNKWLDKLVSKNWVVYCKRPFKDAEQVIKYIGRYTHRVAISDQRIIEEKNGTVKFRYKDYKSIKSGSDLSKTMELTASEFLRRFLWHVLPKGFHKIRHYGFLSNGRRIANINRIKSLIAVCDDTDGIAENNYQPICPNCKTGFFSRIFSLYRFGSRIKIIDNIRINHLRFDSS